MQRTSQRLLEDVDQQRESLILAHDGVWRAYTTSTHPRECSHPEDAVHRFGKTDLTGNPVIETVCTECGVKTDRGAEVLNG